MTQYRVYVTHSNLRTFAHSEGRGKNGVNTPKPLPQCIIRFGWIKRVMKKTGQTPPAHTKVSKLREEIYQE
jgi:hypothetical protein